MLPKNVNKYFLKSIEYFFKKMRKRLVVPISLDRPNPVPCPCGKTGGPHEDICSQRWQQHPGSVNRKL